MLRNKLVIFVIVCFISTVIFPALDIGAVENDRESEMMAVQSTRATVDLAISNVSFDSEYGQPYYPGENVTINVTAHNFGTTAAMSYSVMCSVFDQFSNTTIMTDNSSHILAPYQSGIDNRTYQFTFASPLTSPPEYNFPHIFKVTCTVSITSDENASNNQVNRDLPITFADLRPVLQLGKYDHSSGKVDPTGYDPVQPEVGETVKVPFVLTNEGFGHDLIQIVCDEKPTNWTVGGFSEIFLKFGENTTDTLELVVTISDKNQEALENYDYVIELKAYSTYDPSQYNTRHIHFSINFTGGFSLFTEETEIWGTPGEYVNFKVNLTNTGNGKDSFYSALEPLSNLSINQGWYAFIDAGTLTPAINNGEKYTVRIRVKVPLQAMKGSHVAINLTTKSNKAASTENPVEENITVEIYVDTFYNPILDPWDINYTVDPANGTNELFFNLTNMGNAPDDTIWLNVSKAPDGWNVSLNTSAIPSAGLAYHATAQIGLMITVPQFETPGSGYEIEVEAWAGEDPFFRNDVLTLKINVSGTYNFAVEVDDDIQYVDAGKDLVYNVLVRNLGNNNDTFEVNVFYPELEEYAALDINIDIESITIPANEVGVVNVIIGVPEDAKADTNPATSTINEGYYLDLVVESEGTSEQSISKQLIFKVNPRYDFQMNLENESVTVSADRDDIVPFTVNITNLGNIKTVVDFSVEAEYDWYTFVTLYKFVPLGESRYAVIQIEPYKGLAPGNYVFKVKGTSREDVSVMREAYINITVVSYNFKAQNIKINGESLSKLTQESEYDEETGYMIHFSETVEIEVDIVSTGAAYSAGPYGAITVSYYDGPIPITSKAIYSLADGETTTLTLKWNTTIKELHQIKITIDSADHIPENNEEDNTVAVYINAQGRLGTDDDDDDIFIGDVPDLAWSISVVFLFIIIILAIVIGIVIVKKQRKPVEETEEEPQPDFDFEDRVIPDLEMGTKLEPPTEDVEQMEYDSGDVQDNGMPPEVGDREAPEGEYTEHIDDPNQQPQFDYDPDGVLAEISDQVAGDEKPSDFALNDGGLVAKLAEKFEKGEITEEVYNSLLEELKGK